MRVIFGSRRMKKSAFKYLITTLLLIIFSSITFLPCFMAGLREQSNYSINKEKTEKEQCGRMFGQGSDLPMVLMGGA